MLAGARFFSDHQWPALVLCLIQLHTDSIDEFQAFLYASVCQLSTILCQIYSIPLLHCGVVWIMFICKIFEHLMNMESEFERIWKPFYGDQSLRFLWLVYSMAWTLNYVQGLLCRRWEFFRNFHFPSSHFPRQFKCPSFSTPLICLALIKGLFTMKRLGENCDCTLKCKCKCVRCKCASVSPGPVFKICKWKIPVVTTKSTFGCMDTVWYLWKKDGSPRIFQKELTGYG